MKKGIFCISIDTELLWGRRDLDFRPFIEKTRKERQVIKRLLELFKRYKTPVTWAVVGKLFLEPKKEANNSSLWYGKDIIEMIKRDNTHEIASHSFAHTIFSRCTKQEAERDLKAWVTLARKNGIKPYSFVFPRSLIGHLDLLPKYGFKAFGAPEPFCGDNFQFLRKIIMLIDLFLPTANVPSPTLENGLAKIPSSMLLLSARGLRSALPFFLRFLKAKTGIDKAIKEKGVFRLFFHPVDLVDKQEAMFSTLERIIAYAKDKQKKGKLEIRTMQQIGEETER